MDTDALLQLHEAVEELEKRHKTVLISSINPSLLPEFLKYEYFATYFAKHPPFEKTREALESIGFAEDDIGRRSEFRKEQIG